MGKDAYSVEEWTREGDGKKYNTITKTHERAAGSKKAPRVTRLAVPVEDWDAALAAINGFKKGGK